MFMLNGRRPCSHSTFDVLQVGEPIASCASMSRTFPLILLLLAATAAAQTVVLQPIVTGLDQPVALTHAGDTRLFITQQTGTILIYDVFGIRPTPFLDIRSIVLSG